MTAQTLTKSKVIKKKAQTKQRFLRLPLDSMTIKFLNEIKHENPYFTDLDALRFVIGKNIKKNNHQELLNWLKTNVGSKTFPKLTEDEIFALSKDI